MKFRDALQQAEQNLVGAGFYEVSMAERSPAQLEQRGVLGGHQTRLAIAGDVENADLIVYEALPDEVSLDDETALVGVNDRQLAAGPQVCLVAVEMVDVMPGSKQYASELRTGLHAIRPRGDQKTGIFGRALGAAVAMETAERLVKGDAFLGTPDVLGLIDPLSQRALGQRLRALSAERGTPEGSTARYTTLDRMLLSRYGMNSFDVQRVDPPEVEPPDTRSPMERFQAMIDDKTLPPTLLGFSGKSIQRLGARLKHTDNLHVVRLDRVGKDNNAKADGAFLIQMLDLLNTD